MSETAKDGPALRVGFTCAYTPLPLIMAAGMTPYRVLPTTDAPDEAGAVLHDNICPHVKRVLDRALADELPLLEGMVFVTSCDAMRRLADAWSATRPDDRLFLLDLPSTTDAAAVSFLASQLEKLSERLADWGGLRPDAEGIAGAAARLNELGRALERLEGRARAGTLPGGYPALQQLRIRTVTERPESALEGALEMLDGPLREPPSPGVPLYLVGNVLPEPAAYELLESSGARLVGDDLCTGGRQLWVGPEVDLDAPFSSLARSVLSRPRCSRTLHPERPGTWAREVVAEASARGARGVIVHVVKFCDPYLVRLPGLRTALEGAGVPLLVLEGDCALRTLGQHRTRIEAFVEMLGGMS